MGVSSTSSHTIRAGKVIVLSQFAGNDSGLFMYEPSHSGFPHVTTDPSSKMAANARFVAQMPRTFDS